MFFFFSAHEFPGSARPLSRHDDNAFNEAKAAIDMERRLQEDWPLVVSPPVRLSRVCACVCVCNYRTILGNLLWPVKENTELSNLSLPFFACL